MFVWLLTVGGVVAVCGVLTVVGVVMAVAVVAATDLLAVFLLEPPQAAITRHMPTAARASGVLDLVALTARPPGRRAAIVVTLHGEGEEVACQ
jgi:hypothetical protein